MHKKDKGSLSAGDRLGQLVLEFSVWFVGLCRLMLWRTTNS